jgi:hypothetical protein
LEQAKEGTRRVYFVDAAHFVQSAFLGCLWCFTRLFIRSASGRHRFNVLGALCAVSHQLTTVCNVGYINSESVCELLRTSLPVAREFGVAVWLGNSDGRGGVGWPAGAYQE